MSGPVGDPCDAGSTLHFVQTTGAHNRAAARPWTSLELKTLRQEGRQGARAVAEILQRSTSSVEAAAHRHRVSLRRPGSSRGSVLGQARGLQLAALVRADLVSGTVDAGLIARRMQTDREAQLCPWCGRRPVRLPRAGTCLVCHREHLTAAHLEALEELSAQRAMWSTRQALKRERDRVAVDL